MIRISHYRQSELISMLLTGYTLQHIAESLLLTESQAKRAASAIYQRTKVANRLEFMAQEIVRLRDRKDLAA